MVAPILLSVGCLLVVLAAFLLTGVPVAMLLAGLMCITVAVAVAVAEDRHPPAAK